MKPIVEHLTEFLEKVRKNKVAADFIGDDERSEEFDVKDFDIFGDELPDGVERTFEDAGDRICMACAAPIRAAR